ncbi:MAG: hypothetical protein OEQ53_08835 [Saprospiraceae bacterium]|nr:hypothetical protein [Saprospiraceae bacterium]
MKYIVYLTLLGISWFHCRGSIVSEDEQAPYYLPYVLKSPIEFAQGTITTTNGISFSKNGERLYISKSSGAYFENGKPAMGIFVHDYEEDHWDQAEQVQFGIDIDAYHPVLSDDNEILFFNSRSHPDSLRNSIPHNIWFSKNKKNGWSKPEMVKGINSMNYDSYPSLARNNNIYFNSDRAGGKGGMDIYVSNYVDGDYQEPINLQKLNSTHAENDLVIDREEKFIIFNRYIDSLNEIDLCVSFRANTEWSEPRKLDKINSTDKWELTPSLSPDGKYFFYELDGKIMQIDLLELVGGFEIKQ